MADKKSILDVNGDGKVDLGDLDAASKMTGIKSVDDLAAAAKKAGINNIDDLKKLATKVGITDLDSIKKVSSKLGICHSITYKHPLQTAHSGYRGCFVSVSYPGSIFLYPCKFSVFINICI